MQQSTEIFLHMDYVKSELTVTDKYTRHSHGLKSGISEETFQHIAKQLEPFLWDVMASSSNVNKDSYGKPLKFFSTYYNHLDEGGNVFSQHLGKLEGLFCFPPIPMISMFFKFLQSQKVSCVVMVPETSAHYNYATVSSCLVAVPYSNKVFSISASTGKRIPNVYDNAMIAVAVKFV